MGYGGVSRMAGVVMGCSHRSALYYVSSTVRDSPVGCVGVVIVSQTAALLLWTMVCGG